MGHSCGFYDSRIQRDTAQQGDLAAITQAIQWCLPEVSPAGRGGRGKVRHLLTRVAEHGHPTRMSILHVEDWILARVFYDLCEIEIERRVVLSVQHVEANGVAADLIHHLSQ